MEDKAFQPLPYDPSKDTVLEMFDATEEWVMTRAGDYQTAVAEAFKWDGSNPQTVIIVEWPGRINKTKEDVQVRLMIAPEDAEGLANCILHSCEWLKAAKKLSR